MVCSGRVGAMMTGRAGRRKSASDGGATAARFRNAICEGGRPKGLSEVCSSPGGPRRTDGVQPDRVPTGSGRGARRPPAWITFNIVRHRIPEYFVKPTKSKGWFSRFAKWTAWVSGRPTAFGAAVLVVAVWAVTGPIFGYSDTWQLVINTGTTIVTFLMVFLIQNTQNRDSIAIQIKLDELLRVAKGAQNALLDLEELDEQELDRIRQGYEEIADEARKVMRQGGKGTGVPKLTNGHVIANCEKG
jgi:low affinity Fe/Cu permease